MPSQFARLLSVSPLVIGLTVVAFGSSSPELAVSLRSAALDQADLATGNVVGSNIFNILAVLGGTAALAPEGIVVSSNALQFDIPAMIAVAIACLPIFVSGFRIDRWEGALFVACYGLYIGLLTLRALGSSIAPQVAGLVIGSVTILAVVMSILALLHRRHQGDP